MTPTEKTSRSLASPFWRVLLGLGIAVLAGLVLFAAHVSRATSYLSDDPATCVNCHVMATQYATWANSAHRRVATCNDCHVPHDTFIRHYLFKAMDGARHTTIFTLRIEPQVIRIKPMGQRAVQANCVRCHVDLVNMVNASRVRGDDVEGEGGSRCWDCHRDVPHGHVRSLAAAPYEHVPLPEPITPEWLRRFVAPRETPSPEENTQ